MNGQVARTASDSPAARRDWSGGDRRLRWFFRRLNRFMLWLWHHGLGPWINAWPAVGGRIMVVTHAGRRSGRKFQTPVNYAPADGAVYCTAGFGRRADWYRNLVANPRVEVWLPRERWPGLAEDVSDDADRVRRLRDVLIASGFAAYAAGINPRRISDAELDHLADEYRLLRIRRIGGGSLGGADVSQIADQR